MTINAILRRLRESKNLSQQNVADELDVNVTSIGRWETDGEEIKNSTLKKLSTLYNVKVSDLYTYEQNPSIFEEPIE
jgi:transcriptional regulator with XRE-family HTH domain